MVDLEKVLRVVKLKGAEKLDNVSDELIEIYIDDNVIFLNRFMGYLAVGCDCFEVIEEHNSDLVYLTLFDLNVRGLEGLRNVNEAGQSFTINTKTDLLNELKRYRKA